MLYSVYKMSMCYCYGNFSSGIIITYQSQTPASLPSCLLAEGSGAVRFRDAQILSYVCFKFIQPFSRWPEENRGGFSFPGLCWLCADLEWGEDNFSKDSAGGWATGWEQPGVKCLSLFYFISSVLPPPPPLQTPLFVCLRDQLQVGVLMLTWIMLGRWQLLSTSDSCAHDKREISLITQTQRDT